MASATPDFADIALQFELATARLRVLSALPEAQRQGQVQTAIDDFKTRMNNMEESMKNLSSEVQSFRDATEDRMKALEAKAHNEKMRLRNKNHTNVVDFLMALRNVTTNQEIPNFPTSVNAVSNLNDAEITSLVSDLGWSLDPSQSLREKRVYLLNLMGFAGILPYYLWATWLIRHAPSHHLTCMVTIASYYALWYYANAFFLD